LKEALFFPPVVIHCKYINLKGKSIAAEINLQKTQIFFYSPLPQKDWETGFCFHLRNQGLKLAGFAWLSD
jgi:hypothetical protein